MLQCAFGEVCPGLGSKGRRLRAWVVGPVFRKHHSGMLSKAELFALCLAKGRA